MTAPSNSNKELVSKTLVIDFTVPQDDYILGLGTFEYVFDLLPYEDKYRWDDQNRIVKVNYVWEDWKLYEVN